MDVAWAVLLVIWTATGIFILTRQKISKIDYAIVWAVLVADIFFKAIS